MGLALALGEPWPLILVVLPWAAMNWVVIPFEEARLSETFAQDYARLLSKGSALDLRAPGIKHYHSGAPRAASASEAAR